MESVVVEAHGNGALPTIPLLDYIIFVVASAVPITLAVASPHLVPSSYWRFLLQITNGKSLFMLPPT